MVDPHPGRGDYFTDPGHCLRGYEIRYQTHCGFPPGVNRFVSFLCIDAGLVDLKGVRYTAEHGVIIDLSE